jgi:hypothetical protein
MEAIGIIAVLALVFIGVLYMMKHQKVIGYWASTPHYSKEYKKKMMRRELEDIQEELDRLDNE